MNEEAGGNTGNSVYDSSDAPLAPVHPSLPDLPKGEPAFRNGDGRPRSPRNDRQRMPERPLGDYDMLRRANRPPSPIPFYDDRGMHSIMDIKRWS